MHADKRELNAVTEKVIACAYAVGNELGCGFLEKVYENAMFAELTAVGLRATQQAKFTVRYKGAVIGEYFADLIVEERVLVELKHCKAFDDVHVAQCLNYLKATGLRVCLLINFGKPRIEIKRLVREF